MEQLASAYAALGLQPKDRIGVLGQNAQEWMMAMQVWKVWKCGEFGRTGDRIGVLGQSVQEWMMAMQV